MTDVSSRSGRLASTPIAAEPSPTLPDETSVFGLNAQTPSRVLVRSSYLYLTAPAVLHLGFWLRSPLAALAVVGGVLFIMHLWTSSEPGERRLDWMAPSVAGAVVAFLAGAGGVLSYSGDWRKHFALLRDLTGESWPLVYELPGGDGVLSYNAAWYMPASAIGKLFGWSAANVALSVWLAIGMALVLSWAVMLVGRNSAGLLVLLFSGLDVVGRVLLPVISDWNMIGFDTIDTWAREWQTPSLLRNIFEAPQHTVPTLVAAGLILGGQLRRQPLLVQLAFVAALSINSPFAAVAVLPFAAATFSRRARPFRRTEIGAAAFMLGVVSFHLVRLGGPPVGVPDEVVFGLTFVTPIHEAGFSNHLISFVLVLILEALVFAVPLSLVVGAKGRRMVWLSTAVLPVCLLIRIGQNNDLAMRGPTMAIFVLALFAAKVIVDWSSPWRAVIAGLLLIGTVTPIVEVRRNVAGPQFENYSFTSAQDTAGLTDLQPLWYPDRDSLLSQYLSDTDGPATWVLRLPGEK